MAGVQKTRGASATPSPLLLRTCHNCHQAKIKCDRSSETGPCFRCERLGRPCHFTPARRRQNNPHRDLRIEALESQVQLLLEAGGALTTRSASIDSSNSSNRRCIIPEDESGTRDRQCADLLPSPSQTPAGGIAMDTAPTARYSPTSRPAEIDPISNGALPLEAAEILMDRFKTAMAPHFPFVIVPPHVSLEAIRQTKPFLLLSILAAASYDDVALQRRLGRQVQHCIAEKLIYGDTISLEALQGLLVHLAWSQYHPRPRRYTQLLQLAIGIIVDLRLDRKPDTRPWKTRIDLTKIAEPKEFLELDEQRAVAGCYYLCSTVSTLLQKLSTFPWTPHISDCCKSLLEHQQYPTDKYIPYIIELQRLVESADTIRSTECGTSRSAHVAQLHTRLESIKDSLPFTLTESPMLMTHWNTAMVYMCHIDVCTDSALNSLPTGERWPQWRLEALGTGLVAAKSTLSFFLSLPLGCEMHFNNSEWIQLGFVMTYSARLATLSTQTAIHQETLHLRRFLGMSDMLKDVASRLKSISSSRTDDDGDRDVFNHYQQRVERLQEWFDAQSARGSIATVQVGAVSATATVFNGRDHLHYQEYLGNGQLAWDSNYAQPSQELPVLSIDDVWAGDRSLDPGVEELTLDFMDMPRFGQYFAFDAENI